MLNPKLYNKLKLLSKKYLIFYVLSGIIFFALFLFLLLNLFYWGKVFPGISIAGIDVGGLSPTKAEVTFKDNVQIPEIITLTSDNEEFSIQLEEIDYSIDYFSSVLYAYHRYRTGNVLYDTMNRIRLFRYPESVGAINTINEDRLEEYLSVIIGQIETEPVEPSLELVDGNIKVIKGVKGREVIKKNLRAEIDQGLSLLDNKIIKISFTEKGKVLTEPELSSFEDFGNSIIGKSITVQYDLFSKTLTDKDLISLLDVNNTIKTSGNDILLAELEKEIEREPQNSILTFEEGRVREFVPAKDGIKIDKTAFTDQLVLATKKLSNTETETFTIVIPVLTLAPDIKTEDVNSLGIKELIGRGTSRFSGSIPSRIHNIGVASLKFSGVLVEPNEIVSFNDILGDVSAFTGYKQAYIIKDGKTTLGDGGGVCQVSTTLFRAVLNSGLPIVERRAHSYRVGYYEQDSPVGLDATVYSPTTDFKFKNDTGSHFLIQTEFLPDKAILIFEIYGTSDGRLATTTKPIISSVTAPPEDLYIDDPTLPVGTVKQIDYKAWGAKAYFTYTVEKDGETIFEKTYYSNYQPWQAKFLQGTAPIN
jgi:vancomycin resistance protein YoaR